LLEDLQRLVDPATRGDPMSPLLWTCKSTRHLAQALGARGHEVSHQTVARLLTELGYSLQTNRKTEDGQDHPDRNAQF
jgi:transposase